MLLEEAKEFVMKRFIEEGPATAIEWHLVAKLFRMFADHRGEMLDILPRKNRPALIPDGAKEYINITYGEIMASAGSSFWFSKFGQYMESSILCFTIFTFAR
jgi:hypothetical protein